MGHNEDITVCRVMTVHKSTPTIVPGLQAAHDIILHVNIQYSCSSAETQIKKGFASHNFCVNSFMSEQL
jgi:hypothetical protein